MSGEVETRKCRWKKFDLSQEQKKKRFQTQIFRYFIWPTAFRVYSKIIVFGFRKCVLYKKLSLKIRYKT